MMRTSDPQSESICSNEVVEELVRLLQQNETAAIAKLDKLVQQYSGDARLQFLKGSMLAANRQYDAARRFMRRAVDLAPDFAIARFQLGFLLLTSGEPWSAQEAWGPLHALPEDHYILNFVRGLSQMIRDDFTNAIARLEQGVAANEDNLPLNGDISLIIDELKSRDVLVQAGEMRSSEEGSAAQLLLQQASLRSTRH